MSRPATRRSSRPQARRRRWAFPPFLTGRLGREILALGLLALSLLLLTSLLTYDPSDPAPLFGAASGRLAPHNATGPAGAFLAAASFQLLGLAAYLVPVLLMVAAGGRLGSRSTGLATRLAGLVLLLLGGTGLLSLWFGRVATLGGLSAGGLLGRALAAGLVALLSSLGASIVLMTLCLLSFLLTTRLSLENAAAGAGRGGWEILRRGRLAWSRLREAIRRRRLQRRAVRRHLARSPAAPPPTRASIVKPAPPPAAAAKGAPPPSRQPAAAAPAAEPQQLTFADVPGSFQSPPLSLLTAAAEGQPVDERELVEKAGLLTGKLQEFGVGGSVVAIHPGPVITTFEFKAEPGVKYSRVTTLADDLSLALEAESVRIDRLPGKATISIEVPNRQRETIRIREILESDAYRSHRARLPLALGKSMDGSPYATCLESMPHLLIAGATGSGKSVALNAMIASILFRATPEQVKFIFIDPKMLELGIYENIPHLICPVVTEAARAARVLRWATAEMTRRYQLLFDQGVRNLEQYQRLAARHPEDAGENRPEPLPSLVIVIDELADLMMISSKEVEASIQRLAQMARAVGIHLVVATQRPSVDVLTGVIKANFPCRIAFRVSSRTDSNVILDHKGAERLLGAGDMLFLPPGSATLIRLHGALMEESEALRLAAFLRHQGRPVYNEKILKDEEEVGPGGIPLMPRDVLFDQAARLVASMGQASVSHLQRRLGLGYARAARLMDSLEAEGIVGPSEGSKARQVLVPPDYFEAMDDRSP
ncbi:MAG: DNA translocase FtsK 4TM domain-containing protein [Acidobacteriota bacterium]